MAAAAFDNVAMAALPPVIAAIPELSSIMCDVFRPLRASMALFMAATASPASSISEAVLARPSPRPSKPSGLSCATFCLKSCVYVVINKPLSARIAPHSFVRSSKP